MAKTLKDIKEDYPELMEELKAEILNKESKVSAAVLRERTRLRELDEVSEFFDSATISEAKYGKDQCSAQELIYRTQVYEAAAMRYTKLFTEAMNKTRSWIDHDTIVHRADKTQ